LNTAIFGLFRSTLIGLPVDILVVSNLSLQPKPKYIIQSYICRILSLIFTAGLFEDFDSHPYSSKLVGNK